MELTIYHIVLAIIGIVAGAWLSEKVRKNKNNFLK